MRFGLLHYYQEIEGCPPIAEWAPGDIRARIEFQQAFNEELTESGELVDAHERPERLRSVLHVLCLLFNEGYAASSGPHLARTDLSGEAIRLARGVRAARPDDAEVSGLLALNAAD